MPQQIRLGRDDRVRRPLEGGKRADQPEKQRAIIRRRETDLDPRRHATAVSAAAAGGVVRSDEVGDLRIDFVVPAAAVEHAVMADLAAADDAPVLPARDCGTARARRGLADTADIVALALDGHQRGALDRARIDQFAAHPEAAMRQILPLEHPSTVCR